MAGEFKIELSQEARSITAQLESFPRRMATALRKALDQQNELTISTMVQNRLTANVRRFQPNYTPNLRRISGTLARSFHRGAENTASEEARVEGDTITSAIGSVVQYAGVHEFGFSGTVNVPGHTRRLTQRRAFLGGFKPLTRGLGGIAGATARKSVSRTTQGRDAFVRPHTRDVNLPARRYLSGTIEKRIPQYSAALSLAIENAWNEVQST